MAGVDGVYNRAADVSVAFVADAKGGKEITSGSIFCALNLCALDEQTCPSEQVIDANNARVNLLTQLLSLSGSLLLSRSLSLALSFSLSLCLPPSRSLPFCFSLCLDRMCDFVHCTHAQSHHTHTDAHARRAQKSEITNACLPATCARIDCPHRSLHKML